MKKTSFLLISAVWITLVPALWAQTIDLSAVRDNTIYLGAGNLSNGAGEHLFVGRTSRGMLQRGLIIADVAGSVPVGATINSAVLTLNMSRTAVGAKTIEMHRLLREWGEESSHAPGEEGMGASAASGDATWNHAIFPVTPWTTAGGDFSAMVSASAVVSNAGLYSWGPTSQLTAEVQDMLDNPTRNHGWILVGPEGERSSKRFDTREHPSPSARPVLRVEYTPVREIGKPAGLVSEMLNTDEKVHLLLNITNRAGVPAAGITMEWFMFTATTGGVNLGIFFLSDEGLIPFTPLTDLSEVTFSFDHGADGTRSTQPLAVLRMSDLGFGAGDDLAYAYAYTPSGVSELAIENVVLLKVQ